MGRAVDAGVVAGAVAIGASAEGVVYEGAFGTADVHSKSPMLPNTVFWLLSMTKAFTATACMQLIEQGRLHPDQEAGKILPQLAAPQILEGFDPEGRPRLRPAKRPITVRHLLTHTSGYTYSIWSELLTRYEAVTGLPDIATCRNAAFDAPLEFEPGERWHTAPHKWGYSFDINQLPGPHGRSAGTISWAGLLNCYFWLDPVEKITGAFFTQILPFFDERVVALYGEF